MNYIVQRKHLGKSGKIKGQEVWKVTGYYSTLETALMGFKDMYLLESEAQNIKELKEDLQAIDKKIEGILGGKDGKD